jgi:ubiquitin-protein ligase
MAIDACRNVFGEAAFLRHSNDREEWRIPIKIHNSPLYLKIIMSDAFPYVAPQVQVMAMVSHPSIVESSKMYKGAAFNNWNPNSRLIEVLKQVEAEFNQQPPQLSQ